MTDLVKKTNLGSFSEGIYAEGSVGLLGVVGAALLEAGVGGAFLAGCRGTSTWHAVEAPARSAHRHQAQRALRTAFLIVRTRGLTGMFYFDAS